MLRTTDSKQKFRKGFRRFIKQFFESTYHNLQHKKGLDLAATSLFSLRKADRAIEDFVEDFCIQVDFNGAALKDIFFFFGLN